MVFTHYFSSMVKRLVKSSFLLVVGVSLTTLVSASAQAKQVYKLQVSSQAGAGFTLPLPVPLVSIDTSQQEWLVVTVNGREVTIRHTTTTANFIGLRRWYDHPATSIRMCVTQGFQTVHCQMVEGDTIYLPEGVTIYDVVVDFKYIEGGLIKTRSFQLSPQLKPEGS
jgi:hypothetical protein